MAVQESARLLQLPSSATRRRPLQPHVPRPVHRGEVARYLHSFAARIPGVRPHRTARACRAFAHRLCAALCTGLVDLGERARWNGGATVNGQRRFNSVDRRKSGRAYLRGLELSDLYDDMRICTGTRLLWRSNLESARQTWSTLLRGTVSSLESRRRST